MYNVRLRVPYFKEAEKLQTLNAVIQKQSNIMPHEIAIATGCSLFEAMETLLVAYNDFRAESFLLIYHSLHPETSFSAARPLKDGFPKVPFECEICGEVIQSLDELAFGFSFRLDEMIRFITHNND